MKGSTTAMDNRLPHFHPDPDRISGDSGSPESPDEGPASETLMEALLETLTIDPETQEISGCDNTFRITEEVLRRHGQEDVTAQVLALLRAQGAVCDCDVLLHSRLDLVFLEDDLEFADDEDDEEEEAEEEGRAR